VSVKSDCYRIASLKLDVATMLAVVVFPLIGKAFDDRFLRITESTLNAIQEIRSVNVVVLRIR
jgi:hypothetical protein